MPIRGVADAMREMRAGSDHIKTQAQAVAVGLKQQRRARRGPASGRRSGRRSR